MEKSNEPKSKNQSKANALQKKEKPESGLSLAPPQFKLNTTAGGDTPVQMKGDNNQPIQMRVLGGPRAVQGGTVTERVGDKDQTNTGNYHSLEYQGTDAGQRDWLQFGKIELLIIPNGNQEDQFYYDGSAGSTGGQVAFSNPESDPNWFIDVRNGAQTPFYQNSFTSSLTDDSTKILDAPGGESWVNNIQQIFSQRGIRNGQAVLKCEFKSFLLSYNEDSESSTSIYQSNWSSLSRFDVYSPLNATSSAIRYTGGDTQAVNGAIPTNLLELVQDQFPHSAISG